MSIKFSNIFNKTDWLKMTILIIVAIIAWVFVYREYQKPIIPPEWEKELTAGLNK